ncbi:short-chain alcohol dehydrogenase/reductase [Fulvivirga imtechensis AK7]|uniref:Short-chain alcohol dehydrogenase/reductase n=1 Tax=Fulvivirga imtechensis AK7 TaxID=1237149 RepID=L8JVG2_9BACT|nr:oxidoreductase [Fulvivirga imtechensis]ELR73041.1 short-chain alcohol dehydrogenase/reductase [Fulvivirga imtechensis AK7]
MRKIWLITGISSGLGKAIAQAVMEKGDFVIGTFRKASQVEEFNANFQNKGFSYQLDVTQPDQIRKMTAAIRAMFHRVDVLVNNAGVGMVGAVEETSMDEVRAIFEANFFGTLKLTQEVLPLMRAQRSGHIVQISSHGGVKAFAGFGIYNASKFAVEGFSEALAQEVAPLGIKVTIVEPGPFRTRFAGDSLGTAVRVIEDYNETAGAFRMKLKGVNGKQEGDPQKAAQAIYRLVDSEVPPLRLPLGKTALLTIGMKIDSVKADLEAARTIAEGAIYS